MNVYLVITTFEDGCGENLRICETKVFDNYYGAKAFMWKWAKELLEEPNMNGYVLQKEDNSRYVLYNTKGPDLYYTCLIQELEIEK